MGTNARAHGLRLGAATALLALLLAPAGAAAGARRAQAIERVEIAAGETSAKLTKSVRGFDTRDFAVRAAEGQTLSVELVARNRFLYFTIFDVATGEVLAGDPIPREVTHWSGRVPKAGDYKISVYFVRAEARRKHTASFTLTVSLDDRDGAPAAAGSVSTGAGLEASAWALASMVREGDMAIPVPPDVRITATFKDGRVSGKGGCNGYFATYTARDGGAVEIGDVGATRMHCSKGADLEAAYFALLRAATSYTVDAGGLTLRGPSGTLAFVRAE